MEEAHNRNEREIEKTNQILRRAEEKFTELLEIEKRRFRR